MAIPILPPKTSGITPLIGGTPQSGVRTVSSIAQQRTELDKLQELRREWEAAGYFEPKRPETLLPYKRDRIIETADPRAIPVDFDVASFSREQKKKERFREAGVTGKETVPEDFREPTMFIDSFWQGIQRSYHSILEPATGYMLENFGDLIDDPRLALRGQEVADKALADFAKRPELKKPEDIKGFTSGGIGDIRMWGQFLGEQAAYMAAAIGSAIAAGPAGGYAAVGAIEASQLNQDLLNMGVNPDEAKTAANIYGAVASVLENNLGVRPSKGLNLFNATTKKEITQSFLGFLAKEFVKQGAGGALQEGAQQLAENITKRYFNNNQDLLEGLAESATAGFFGEAILGGTITTIGEARTSSLLREAITSEAGFAKIPDVQRLVEKLNSKAKEVKISELTFDETNRQDALADADTVFLTQTDSPILVSKNEDGSFNVEDGNGRVVQAERNGETTIKITEDAQTYRELQEAREFIIAEARAGLLQEVESGQAEIQDIKPETITADNRLFLTEIKNDIKTAFKDKEISDQQFLEEVQAAITQGLDTAKGKMRSSISFVRNIAELNQTAINDAKATVGMTGPVREANIQELSDLLVELKRRLAYKRERGFVPEINRVDSKRSTKISEDVYKANRGNKKSTPKLNVTKKIGEFMTPISTRLANISRKLRERLKRFEFDTVMATQKDIEKALPYLDKTKKISKGDLVDLDFALKNGDTTKIEEINKKYKIEKEYKAVQKVLDSLYKRANDVGFDIGYTENYFPRMVKDVEGLMAYWRKTEDWGILDRAIKEKELSLGRNLNEVEKANLINTMVRGYSGGQISLQKTGAMKERRFDFVTPEMNRYYMDSTAALVAYIRQTNDSIEARKFFGKERAKDGSDEQFNNIEDSIGAYTTELIANGEISPAQEMDLRQILNARFNERGTSGLMGVYKNLAYIDVMGSPINAITQVGDLAFPMYNIATGKAGVGSTIKAFTKATLGKSKIKKEDIGIDSIAAEFSDASRTGKAVDRVFRLVGLNNIDRIGKETLINPIIERFQSEANNPSPEFVKQLEEIFDSPFNSSAQEVLEELRSGVITDNVKYLAFSRLLDFQPVAMSEMPEKYLTSGNARIFYMLKSWTLKMFDVFRRESFDLMNSKDTRTKIEGATNMIKLASLLVLMNGTADEIKDLMLGRKTSFKDRTIDNLLKLIGFSRYNTYQVSRDGLGSTILKQTVSFPTKSIDNISKDVMNMFKDFDESWQINNLRSTQNIPVVGKLYYWWFGKGADAPSKTGTTNKLKIKATTVTPKKIKIKPIKIKNVKIRNQ